MKPRIVRESDYVPSGKTLHEDFNGPAYLALPWPPACPWTPEQVMAACEQHGGTMVAVPYPLEGAWIVGIRRPHDSIGMWCPVLTPDFMGEFKGYCPGGHIAVYSPKHGKPDLCLECGCPKDRRAGERRKGERRAITGVRDWSGGRRKGTGSLRRMCITDRRHST